jgi:hypothetical protein
LQKEKKVNSSNTFLKESLCGVFLNNKKIVYMENMFVYVYVGRL